MTDKIKILFQFPFKDISFQLDGLIVRSGEAIHLEVRFTLLVVLPATWHKEQLDRKLTLSTSGWLWVTASCCVMNVQSRLYSHLHFCVSLLVMICMINYLHLPTLNAKQLFTEIRMHVYGPICNV